jgi:hypothetical protein
MKQDPRIDKLPKWVQAHIADLERKNANRSDHGEWRRNRVRLVDEPDTILDSPSPSVSDRGPGRTTAVTYLDKDQVLATLEAEQQVRQSNFDEALARSDESDIATCRAESQRIAEIKVLWNIIAALPAIPLDHEAQSLIEKELRRANAHVEDTKRRGEAEMCARWVNYADGLQFALEKMAGALPVLETKKETP